MYVTVMFTTILLSIVLSVREVKDRDEINEFLRNEIRMTDMRAKVRLVCIPNCKKQFLHFNVLV